MNATEADGGGGKKGVYGWCGSLTLPLSVYTAAMNIIYMQMGRCCSRASQSVSVF